MRYFHILSIFLSSLWIVVPAARAAQPLTADIEQQLRKQIIDNFFIPDPLPPCNGHTYRVFSPAAGVKAEAVTFDTQLGMSVPAILYLPDPLPHTANGKIPAVVIIDGHGGDKYSWYSFYSGILFARGGAAVLTYDQIGEGERNKDRKSATRAHDQLPPDPILARHLAGLMITDVRQAVSYLCQRPEVDEQRIAVAGYSMGSFVGALTGAVDMRIHACTLVAGGNLDGPGGRWDKSHPICQGLPYQSLNFLGDRPAVIYALHASRGPTLIFNGLGDTNVSIVTEGAKFFDDLRARTIALHGSPAGVFEFGFAPPDSGHRPYFVTRPVVQWLNKQIAFPNWTADSIQSMPEIKIGDWATSHSVSIEKAYATDDKEAGTPALAADVPGYARESLDVFTPEHWQPLASSMTLEGWVDRVNKKAEP